MLEWQDEQEGITVVRLTEESLTASNAASFRARLSELAEGGRTRLILDLANVRYVDSSGLGALVSLLKRIGVKGELALCAVAPAVMSVLTLTRMDKVFSIYADRGAAVEGLSE
ncbi:STAS domain-containing protein [Pelagibacterium limicola]|uniref:STAS domain-containing protein n=1 Tax=Pelagibacterium limicola TaxID=2791022 RepID=UPI0018AF7023|nr:STAS domain-containing protein [Pelagibacterium limicola]